MPPALLAESVQAPRSIAEQVYDLLRTQILDQDLLPGERLLEVAVSKSLKVSRTPVREAFRLLQQDESIAEISGKIHPGEQLAIVCLRILSPSEPEIRPRVFGKCPQIHIADDIVRLLAVVDGNAEIEKTDPAAIVHNMGGRCRVSEVEIIFIVIFFIRVFLSLGISEAEITVSCEGEGEQAPHLHE